MKHQRPRSSGQSRRGQQPGTVDVQQVSASGFHDPLQPGRLPWDVGCETNEVAGTLGAGPVWTARDRMRFQAECSQPRRKLALAGYRGFGGPAPLQDRWDQIQQTALSAAQVSELVEEEDVHRALPAPGPRNRPEARASR